MIVQKKYSLKKLNTFGIDVIAEEFISVSNEKEVFDLIEQREMSDANMLILGGGSNILFEKNYEGLIVKSDMSGINVIEENSDEVIIEAGSGVEWDDLVEFSVENGFCGIENLSLIPGTVGAAPIQNIGAYGVELESVFVELEGIDLFNSKKKIMGKRDCRFGYRDSIFKRELKNRFFITKVRIKLSKTPQLKFSYRAVRDYIAEHNIDEKNLDIGDIRNIIISIRRSKLPDPLKIGNAGSFFKNPVIGRKHFNKLKKKYRDLVFFKISEDEIKIPAGWLIEKSGFKGKKFGNAGVHSQQALVLVNLGNAGGSEIVELAERIKSKIFNIFNIVLETEVNIV